MTFDHYLGALAILLLITGLGIYSGKKVKSAAAFTGSDRTAGAGIVAGSIIGSMVGGASTIGTAQLAFEYGFSAWWFTLGAGLGCLVLAAFFAGPLYRSGVKTLPQVFAEEYGRPAATASALLTTVGNFLTIASQVLSGVALVTALGDLGPFAAGAATVALMLAYVVFGGVWGAGIVGMAKSILVYLGVGACGIIALASHGGFAAMREALPGDRYFNLIARGALADIGAGLSLVCGVLATQAYIQAVLSAKSLRVALRGVYACALLIPVIGVAGIFVGMYMKLHHPDINPAFALPLFILEKTPPLAAGALLATLLVTLVGTGAGIALGVSSMLCNDIYKVYVNPEADDAKTLLVSRLIIVLVLAAALATVFASSRSLILGWSYLSMGLRGAAAFAPLCAAVFLRGRIGGRYALAAMIVGCALVLLSSFLLPPAIDPLFPGLVGSTAVLAAGYAAARRRP